MSKLPKTYLSIDLDYGLFHASGFHATADIIHLSRLAFWNVLEHKIPISFRFEHHHLLYDMDRTRFERLINVDYHSDIAGHKHLIDKKTGILDWPNEGTWGNYVADQESREFIWLHPNKDVTDGRCDGSVSTVFRTKTNWLSCRERRGIELAVQALRNPECLAGIGICGFESPEHLKQLAGGYTFKNGQIHHCWISQKLAATYQEAIGGMFEKAFQYRETNFIDELSLDREFYRDLENVERTLEERQNRILKKK